MKDVDLKDKMLCLPLETKKDGSTEILRLDETGVYTGSVRPIKDGAPIPKGSQLLNVKRIEGADPWLEGEVIYSDTEASNGPPKVNSKAFKSGWDVIWGKNKDLN